MLLRSHRFPLRPVRARKTGQRAKSLAGSFRPQIEQFEDRCVPSATYLVSSLADTNIPGTLRFALNQANANHSGTAAAPDLIQFSTGGGTIHVNAANGGPLGLSANEVAVLDATTATGYSGTPLITLDGSAAGAGVSGLTISGGSSTVKGFDIIDFSGSGIRLDTNGGNTVQSNYIGITTAGMAAGNGGNGIWIVGSAGNAIGGNVISANGANGVWITGGADSNTLSGNFIGTGLGGATALGNALDGVRIDGSNHNLIGHSDPITGISYYNTNQVSIQPVSGWQGIRAGNGSGQYLITGTSNSDGLLFDGTIAGVGTSYLVRYPGASTTSVYGPNNLGNGMVQLVGNYKNADYATAPVFSNGFIFEGSTSDLSQAGNYKTIDYPGAKFNYVHSTMGGLAVGNYDSPPDHGMGNLPFGPGHAFIYDIAGGSFLTDVVFPGSLSNTAYGIWYNGGTSYTICGGYSTSVVNNFDDQSRPIGKGYLVDYDSKTGAFSHWTSFDYPNGINFVTHFEGISSVEKGVYTLNADSVQAGSSNPAQGSWVTVRRNTDGSFGNAVWVDLNDPNYPSSSGITSSNSVYGNQVVGIVIGQGTLASFQATINTGFQLSNVISGNGGNGIGLYGANDNQVAMNYIGTNAAGTVVLGNGGSGILVTAGATRNLIGGEATGGNDPTNSVFVRPPQGNLISGNSAYGVLVSNGANDNQLSGNFIGTTAAGTAALANRLDGVAIVSADNNSLIGCTFQQDPFVFYNVISGNGGNGLRIADSNNTTVQANFFGLGADNNTPVGNALDGLLIQGTSANTQFGGVIPLGNVDAANGRNGVEIADSASGTVCFNTFCGLPAFKTFAVGNKLDGFLITSTGGNNLLRTNVISGNLGNGVHISGNATDVQVAEDIIGMTTNGQAALPNGANGILIDGNANHNLIGGKQASVIFQNTISKNGANGIAIVGNARDNVIFHSFIGTEILGVQAFGNGDDGILIGGNAQDTTIGGTAPFDQNVISGNQGDGIQLSGTSHGTQVIGNFIGSDRNGRQPVGNQGNGIGIISSNNEIGGTAADTGNVIAFNSQAGVFVDTGIGNGIQGNSLFGNGWPGILLANNGNLNQPAPVLTGTFSPTPNTVQVTGTLKATANTTYTVEIFASPDGTPPGQGKTLLGSLTVTTAANGFVPFVFSSSLPVNAGSAITATATDPQNNTSALSASISLGGNANNLFVASAYGLLLNRAPDAAASSWVQALNGKNSPASVVLGIEGSTEYLTDQVSALYARYLNRAPDSSGEQHWLNVLMHGGTLEQVAEGIVSSPEYFQDHGGTNQGYVMGLYQQVLGRTPSVSELNSWVSALNAGQSRLAVAIGFLTSTEYRTDLVEADYNLYLGRSADSTGLANWVAALQAGATDQAVLAGILGSAEGFRMWS
jgi:parallel beta-helix repeat protein